MPQIIVVSGAYGVGKSEFATQWALQHAPCYLADIDIINPYFRPREQAEWLKERGVKVIGSHLKGHINQDFPALSGDMRQAMKSGEALIIDCAGSENGLKPLASFEDVVNQAKIWLVVNLMRSESDIPRLKQMISLFESMLHKQVTGFVHNTHLLDESSAELILEAQKQMEVFSEEVAIPIVMTMVHESIHTSVQAKINNPILVIKHLIHRAEWMEKGTR
jgi:hypothetical protein